MSQLVRWLLPQVRPRKLEKLLQHKGCVENPIPTAMRVHVSALLVYKTAVEFLGWFIGCLLPAEDVNQGHIRYVMHEEKVQETMDSFQFLVKDSKPNVVSGNIFHVQWSLLSFTSTR